MATIYLSSTYEDLKDYRCVVVEVLQKALCPCELFWHGKLTK